MKKISVVSIVFLSLFFSQHLFAQENAPTFRVICNGTAVDINKYIVAVQAADMESYRYRSFADTLVFDNGVLIEFYSAQQLFVTGKNIVVDNYSDERNPHYIKPVFHLTEQGTLIAFYQPVLTK